MMKATLRAAIEVEPVAHSERNISGACRCCVKHGSEVGMRSLDEIREVVCDVFGCSADEFHSKSRVNHLIWARHAFILIVRERYAPMVSYPVLGRYLRRDHCTVVSGHRSAKRRLEQHELFRTAVDEAREKLWGTSGPSVAKMRAGRSEETSG